MALSVLLLACFITSTGVAAAQPAPEDQPWLDPSLPPEERAGLLLGAMTLEEKIDLVTGDLNNLYGFFNAPIPRLGIPALTMADGPQGVRIANPDVQGQRATQLPAAIALAATWDTELAARYGDLIGEEAFNTTHNVMLGPGLDIARLPWGARNFESMGEDPRLQSEMAVPSIRALQSHPVLSTAKHYNLNNQETERFQINVQVGEQALQEIYTAPFDAAVNDADLGAVMCAFNRVGGLFACENPTLLTDILKNQLGFDGWVMSDYGANESTVESANAGLDQEMPGDPIGLWGDELLAAVQAGEVSEATIDDKARRILRQMFEKGLFDNPAQDNPLPVEEHGQEAREFAEQAMVLLRNEGSALPLSADDLESIAVIGPDADNTSAAGGGSGLVMPTYTVSPLEGIVARAGSTPVSYAPGTDPISAGDLMPGPPAVPSSFLAPAGGAPGETGMRGEYWTNTTLEGEPFLVRTDPQVNLALGFYNFGGFNAQSPKLDQLPSELNGFMSARWTGTITAPQTGDYELSLTGLGSSQLFLDDQLLLESEGTDLGTVSTSVPLTAGETRAVRIEYRTDSPRHDGRLVGALVRFGWRPAPGAVAPMMQEAVDLASEADVAVVVNRTYESEGTIDRTELELPNNQDQLIREVAAVNPRTIVVLMSGTTVETQNWQAATPAILQAWFAGQEQGNALARVLFGDVNPSGKLPVTFPVDEASTPVSSPEQFPGTPCPPDDDNDGGSPGGPETVVAPAQVPECTVLYSEGIFVGYRGYEQFGIEPQFPFGHGLSYTTFEYARLHTRGLLFTPGGRDRPARVTLTVRNTGDRSGSEIVQVYVGRLPTDAVTEPKELAGFAKVDLQPGERRRIAVEIDRRALSHWDEASEGWVTPTGEVPVYVGGSSRDLRLEGTIRVRQVLGL